MKVKDLPVLIKAGPDDGLGEGQFTAYASVFGNVDSYGDVVMPGAFKDSLAEWASGDSPIPLLWGHNMADPDFNIGHVLSAKEDDFGLLVTAQLDLESPKAAQTYRLLKGKRVKQMSFAYDILDGAAAKSTNEAGGQVEYYELRKLKLYEVSVVPIGANQETDILAVKALAEGIGDGISAKAGRAISAKNEGELRKAYEAIGAVLSSLDTTDDQEKASGTGAVKDDDPDQVKSEAPSPSPSALILAAHTQLLLTNEGDL